MLPFLKKKNKESSASHTPAWHPNFRNYERLPDIKVVRTAFFVNGGAVLLAIVLGVYLGIHEFELHNLKGQIANLEKSIADNQGDSTKAVALYTKFQAEENKVREVETFMKSKPIVSEFVQRLGDTRPKNIAFESIDFKDVGVTLRTSVRGTADEALKDAQAFQEQLKNDPAFASKIDEVQVNPQNRNATTGRTPVEYFIKLKVPGAPAAAAPKK